MKVAFVHSWNMWGGGERHTAALASILRERGHQVWVIQCGHDQFAPYWPGDHRLSVKHQHPGVLTWLRLLHRIAPDVISEVRGGWLRFGGGLDLAACFLRIRSVPIEHAPSPPPLIFADYGSRRHIPAHCCTLMAYRLRKMIHKLAVTHSIAVAEHVGTSASRYFGLAVEDLSVVHSGVDLAGFVFSDYARARTRTELGVDHRVLVVGAIGRLSAEKRFDLLLRAFAMFRKEYSGPAVLVIAGDGPAKGELQRLRDDLQLESAVRFLGFRDDVPAVLCAMDIVASASGSEGLSLALLEALATARVCVCLPYAGLEEIASSNPAVKVARSRSLADFVDALGVVSALSLEARTALGLQGRVAVQHRFNARTQLLRLATTIEAFGRR